MIKRKIANRLFNNLLAIVFCGTTSNIKVKLQSIRLNHILFKYTDYQLS